MIFFSYVLIEENMYKLIKLNIVQRPQNFSYIKRSHFQKKKNGISD